MRKAERILKKCNEYYELISKVAVKVKPTSIPQGRRGRAAPSSGGGTPASIRPTTPTATDAPITHTSGYTFEVKPINPNSLPSSEANVGQDKKVTVYLDPQGKILHEYLPKELQDIVGKTEGDRGKILAKEIKDAVTQKIKSDKRIAAKLKEESIAGERAKAIGEWRLARNLSSKISAATQVAKAYPIHISALGITTLMVLGGLYYLLTKQEPQAQSDFGKKIKDGSKEIVSGLNEKLVPQNIDLKSQVDSVSKLAKKYSEIVQEPQNKSTLNILASLLDLIYINLDFKPLVIDEKSSQESVAKQFSSLNKLLGQLMQNKYLNRFSRFLQSKNDSSGAELVNQCENGLSIYRAALTSSNNAAQSAAMNN